MGSAEDGGELQVSKIKAERPIVENDAHHSKVLAQGSCGVDVDIFIVVLCGKRVTA